MTSLFNFCCRSLRSTSIVGGTRSDGVSIESCLAIIILPCGFLNFMFEFFLFCLYRYLSKMVLDRIDRIYGSTLLNEHKHIELVKN